MAVPMGSDIPVGTGYRVDYRIRNETVTQSDTTGYRPVSGESLSAENF